MAQFDYQDLVSGGSRCGTPTHHEILDEVVCAGFSTCEGDLKLFYIVVREHPRGRPHHGLQFDAIPWVPGDAAMFVVQRQLVLSSSARWALVGRDQWTATFSPRASHETPSESFRRVKMCLRA